MACFESYIIEAKHPGSLNMLNDQFKMTQLNQKRILLIEDNPGDIKLFEEAVSAEELNIVIDVVEDGEAALEYYQNLKANDFVDSPSLIISDLNIPKISGLDVIKQFKSDSVFKIIPIIVLSTSNLDTDIKECYSSYVNAFLVKPIGIDEFFNLVKLVDQFWLRTCHLATI